MPIDNVPRHKSRWRYWWIYILVLAVLLLVWSALVPSLNPPHPTVPRAKCASNLHQLGLGIEMYAEDHQGQYPDSLEALIVSDSVSLNPIVLICPDSEDTAAAGATTQQVSECLQQPGHNSYVYLGKGMNSKMVPADAVIIYEAHFNHGGKGMNVLYGDGHAEWAGEEDAAKILAKVSATSRPVRFP